MRRNDGIRGNVGGIVKGSDEKLGDGNWGRGDDELGEGIVE